MRKPFPTLLVLALALALGACSWFRDKPPEYLASREAEPLRVPEGYDMPNQPSPVLITAPEMRLPSGDELDPGPPRVASTGGGGNANAFMAWSAEGVYLKVRDSAESVERRLGFVIGRSGMEVLGDAGQGAYRFQYSHVRPDDRSFWQKLAFWRGNDGPNYSGIYRTQVVADGDEARVYLLFDDGSQATTNAAEHVLGLFMERLG
jgi:uncharacterized lipoprotein